MKILIVSQYYKPEVIHVPPTLAQGLAQLGHDVTVITGFPNYPAGRIFPGYRQRLRHTEQDGPVTVRRVPLWISHSENPVGRFLNYLSFAFSAFLAMASTPKPDVTYVYATQMTPVIGPSIMRFVFGRPYVMHIQDLWPESVTGSSLVGGGVTPRIIGKLLAPWLAFLYRQADATIAIAPTMAAVLMSRGVPGPRIHTIFNWANESVLNDSAAPPADRTRRSGNPARVIYAGNLGDHQDLETVLRAVSAISDVENIHFDLYGSGVAENRLRKIATDLGLHNVTFHGRLPAEAMKQVYDDCDFQLITLRDREIFRGTIPSKLQASLFYGSPVLTNVAGDVTRLCEEVGFGLSCEPGSIDAMASMFRRAAETSASERAAMSTAGRSFYRSHMSYAQGVASVAAVLSKCATVQKED